MQSVSGSLAERDGEGRCSAVGPGTPCADDDDCSGGVCCAGVCRRGWAPLGLPIDGRLEYATKLLAFPSGIIIVGTTSGRLLQRDTVWHDITPEGLTSVRALDGASENAIVVASWDGRVFRLNEGVWTDASSPDFSPVEFFVVDASTFYVSADPVGPPYSYATKVYRWSGSYTELSEDLPTYSYWQTFWRYGTELFVGGGYYLPIPLQRRSYCETPYLAAIRGDGLQSIAAPESCPERSSGGRYGVAVFNTYSEGTWIVGTGGYTKIDNRNAFVASAGARPSVFLAGDGGFHWNTDGVWRSYEPTPVRRSVAVAAIGTCDAFGLTEAEAYQF